MPSRTTVVLVSVLLLAGGGVGAYEFGYLSSGNYERTTVTVGEDGTNDTLATVNVRVADTFEKRYTGLSNTESLDDDEGMLFVHDSEGQHAYVMRDMNFSLDIVFIDANGTITAIHHARLPDDPDGQLTRYEGRGKYVLEVPHNYTIRHGIRVGDRVRTGISE